MKIGEVIRMILKRKGMTQMQLAAHIYKSQTSVSQIMTGKATPHPKTMEKIGAAFNIPVGMLWFFTLNKNDVPEDKRELFNMAWPAYREMLLTLFCDNNEN